MTLLLVNHYHTDIDLTLLQPKGRRMQTYGCRIPASGALDICARLGMPKDEARVIVETSPDYIAFHSRNRMVELVDPTEPSQQSETPVGGDPLPPVFEPKILNPVIARLLDEQRLSEEPLPMLAEELVDSDTDIAQPEATGALDPGVKDALADSMPSSRWSREKLIDFANAKGLDISDDMSKNAILRKLRGV